MLIFTIHLFLLISLLYFVSRRILTGTLERVFATYIMVWANIVVTGLVLSCFSKLGDRVLYFRFSILLALVVAFAYRRDLPCQDAAVNEHPEVPEKHALFFMRDGFLYLSLAVVACVNILVGLKYSPNNWDSLTYHLPRIHFYLSQGNLAHFDTVNLRQIFFPFNATLFQLFLVTYGQSDKLLNVFNIASWVLSFFTVYSLSRKIGIAHYHALLSAWIGVMATQVLAQATSTTNDILTAVPLVIAVIFALEWWKTRRIAFAIMFGIATGLTFGTKLTAIFFVPAVLIVVGFSVIQIYRSTHVFPLGKRELGHTLLSVVIIIMLSTPFMGINYYYTHQLSTEHYNYLLNSPFSLMSAMQTFYTYAMQVVIDPFQQLGIKPSGSSAIRDTIEPFLKKYLLAGWNPKYAVSELSVFSVGVSENQVFFGFAGILAIASFLVAALKSNLRKHPAFYLSLIAVGWFITYCVSAKWSLYNQRYFISAFFLMLPLAGVTYETAKQDHSPQRSWIRWLFVFVVATSFIFSVSYLLYNDLRKVRDIFKPDFNNGRIAIPDAIKEEVLKHSKIKFVYSGYTHEDERLYQFMMYGNEQAFSIGKVGDDAGYNIYSFWGITKNTMFTNIASSSAFALLNVPGKTTAGVRDLGYYGDGLNSYRYYGVPGNRLHDPVTPYNSNILVRVLFERIAKKDKLPEERLRELKLYVAGLHVEDNIILRIYYTDMKDRNILLKEATTEFDSSVIIPEQYKALFIEACAGNTLALMGSAEIKVGEYGHPSKKSSSPQNSPDLINIDAIVKKELPNAKIVGMGPLEGPYPQWDLPEVRWAKNTVVKIDFISSAEKGSSAVDLTMSFRPQVRDQAALTLQFNGKVIKKYQMYDRSKWNDDTVRLPLRNGENSLELQFEPVKGQQPPPDSLYMLFRLLSLKSIAQ